MTLRSIALLVFLLPSALLVGALGFQYIVGLAPCDLCIDQRWPHVFAAVMGLVACGLLSRQGWAKIAIIFGAIGMAVSGAVAVYHSGVERKIWSGPSSCSNRVDPNLSPEDYLKAIEQAAIVSCGDITWSLLGLSMANYNALISLGAAGAIFWMVLRLRVRR